MSKTPAAVQKAPTAVIGTVATILFTVLAKLTASGTIPANVAKSWGPWAVLLLVAVFFALVWFHVTPAVKVEQLISKHQAEIQGYADQLDNGRLPEADLARVRGEFEDAATGILTEVSHLVGVPALAGIAAHDLHLTGDAHPDAAAVGAPTVPTGQAGAPAVPAPAPLVQGTLAPAQVSPTVVPPAPAGPGVVI